MRLLSRLILWEMFCWNYEPIARWWRTAGCNSKYSQLTVKVIQDSYVCSAHFRFSNIPYFLMNQTLMWVMSLRIRLSNIRLMNSCVLTWWDSYLFGYLKSRVVKLVYPSLCLVCSNNLPTTYIIYIYLVPTLASCVEARRTPRFHLFFNMYTTLTLRFYVNNQVQHYECFTKYIALHHKQAAICSFF